MFKNIQNRLLLRNPMLWNLKIVPFAFVTIAVHIIFFVIGYANGAIDFTETNSNYIYNFNNEIVMFVGILISLIIFIIWLVVYSRNNGFKSFYPKKNNSLFKEWLLILLFCLLNVSYSVTYLYAGDLKARNYFSEQEFNKRCRVIAMSSLFLEGSFIEPNYIVVPNEKTPDTTDQISVPRDSFQYNKRAYSLKSLINKRIDNFTIFQTEGSYSIYELKVKNWLIENKKDSVQWLFKEYDKILKEHNLKTNITPEKWFDLVYNYPDFTDYKNIGKIERERRFEYNYGSYEGVDTNEEAVVESVEDSVSVQGLDSISKVIKTIDGSEYIYSKYYVSHNALLRSYGIISKSWENPNVDQEMLLVFLYLGIGVSLVVFTFKVTSGRNWLIALLSIGIVGILAGIIAAIVSILVNFSYTFPIFYALVFVGLLVYFIIVSRSKTKKGISGITLNQLVWMFPAMLPIIYFVGLDMAKEISGYKTRYHDSEGDYEKIEQFPRIEWLQDHSLHFMVLNVLIIIVVMYLFSIKIKKWKGIPEA